MATKAALGRLALAAPAEVLLPAQRALHGVSLLSVEERHVRVSAGLPRHHADPFDRLLVAQALCEGLTLVSYDAGTTFPGCGERRGSAVRAGLPSSGRSLSCSSRLAPRVV